MQFDGLAGASEGALLPNGSSFSWGWPPHGCSAVQNGPGATAFARMPPKSLGP